MAEIGYSVVSETVKSLLKATIRQARYSLCFNKYVEELGRQKEKLTITRESIQNRAEKAKQETKEIDVLVTNWLKEANSLIEEVQKLEKKANSNKSYCFGNFPNFIWRYPVGKKVEEKTKAVIDLNQESNFPEFAHPATPPGMEYFSSEGFIFFESTRIAYGKLLEALKNDEVSMIGLYGMGGCGKTTLVKQVGKAAEKAFNKVAFAVVSNNVDVQKIQGEIASYLDLDLKGKEVLSERARILWSRLTNGEKILIILDDVWEKLDFEAIGIPLGENRKGCKVLLTSRRVGVCTSMDCQKAIHLSLLNEEEALTLFQNHARITSDSLNGLAKEITKECKGLPIAIAVVASTLKGKSDSEWEEALEKLREATPMEVEEGLRDPYNCLMLSYDNLINEQAKSLFLMCSVFPEDFEIHEEYLARYGIGLGLFGEVISYERARNQMSVAKNKLIDSCLLLKGDEEQCVKMHDLVRDMALYISKKEKKMIMGPESSRRLSKMNPTLEDNTIRYLWCDMTWQLDCPQVEFLYWRALNDSISVDGVFRTMKDLRVLVLKHENSNRTKQDLSVAKSTQWPTNLHCLFLEGWKLGDTSFLGSLKRLECLVLWNCSFEKLPDEITELSKLKLLDLCGCEIERNPYEMIGRCSQLEELYFVGNEWVQKGEIPAVFLDKNNGLQRYRIELGDFRQFRSEDFSVKRGLCITNFDALISSAAIQDLVQRAEFLRLNIETMGGCKNIIPDFLQAIGGAMNELTQLRLDRCHNIECLVDTSNPSFKVENVFSKLVTLNIWSMDGLETLWRGPHVLKLNLLCKLSLIRCPMLTSVFTCAVAQSLVMLEVIDIFGCDNLKHIVRDEEKDNDQKNSASIFPKLKKLSVCGCGELEYLIPVSFAGGLVQLESLKEIYIDRCYKLKHIVRDEENDNDQKNSASIFPKLKNLSIKKCSQLEYLIPVSFVGGGLVQLETILIFVAPKLIHVFGQSSTNHEDHNQNRFHIINLPVLKRLILQYLPNMKAICPENYYPTWPSLKELNWYDCPQLKVVSVNKCIDADSQVITQQGDTPTEEQRFGSNVMHDSQTIGGGMNELTQLYLDRCHNIECLVDTSNPSFKVENVFSKLVMLDIRSMDGLETLWRGPHVLKLNLLCELSLVHCPMLTSAFTCAVAQSLVLLEKIYIRDCDKLKHIVRDEEKDNDEKNTSSEKFHNVLENPGTSKCFSLYERLSRPFNLRKLKKYEEDQKNQSGEIAQEVHDVQSYVSMFPRLKILQIIRCNLLEYIFPVSFARDLVKFEKMAIYQKDQNSSNYHCQQVCFPSLTEIEIQECNNSKYLFVIFSSHELPLLNKLTIKGCSLLENVFACKESDTEDGRVIMLSKLTKLRLSKLPNLINIFKGFKWQSVDDCEVTDCPKLTSTTTAPFKDLPQQYQNPEEENKESKREEEHKEQEDVTVGNMNIIDQSTISCPESKVPSQTALTDPKEDVNMSAPLAATNQEYQTSVEKGGNIKKMEDKNATEQSTTSYPESTEAHKTQTETTLPESTLQAAPCPQIVPKEYNQNDSGIKSDKVTDIDKGRGDLQTQGFDTSINHFNTEESLQEQNTNLRENMKENAKDNYKKCAEPEKSTEATSPLDLVIKEPMSELVLMDRQEELEQKQVNRTDLSSDVLPNITEPTNNGVSKASDSKKLEDVDRTSPISQSFSSMAIAAVSPRDMPSGLDLNKATETITDAPKQWEDSYQEPSKDSKIMHQPDILNSRVGSSGDAPTELPSSVPAAQNVHVPLPVATPDAHISSTPLSSVSLPPIHALPPEVNPLSSSTVHLLKSLVEEYGAFRDIGAVKKKHIPLLEQAIAKHPSLWAWQEKFKHPQMKQFGYTMLGNMLEFLASTRWRDLTEDKKAELQSLVDVLETLGFDIQWLGNIHAMINQSNEETVNHIKALEEQVAALEIELENVKLKRDAKRAELGNFSGFIGF